MTANRVELSHPFYFFKDILGCYRSDLMNIKEEQLALHTVLMICLSRYGMPSTRLQSIVRIFCLILSSCRVSRPTFLFTVARKLKNSVPKLQKKLYFSTPTVQQIDNTLTGKIIRHSVRHEQQYFTFVNQCSLTNSRCYANQCGQWQQYEKPRI